jgi:hypothetical protein
MEFEILKTEAVGSVKTIDETTKAQYINITVGVVGCPHEEISVTTTVEYQFSTSSTVADVEAGIQTFAQNWMSINYPNIV